MRHIFSGRTAHRLAAAALTLAALGGLARLRADGVPSSIRLTSPLGRTGLSGIVRIVAQVRVPKNTPPPAVRFFVDGKLVGTATDGPPFAAEWNDENPFERRQIAAEFDDESGRVVRDEIALPAFEINDTTDVTSVLLEAGVYDVSGRFIPQLPASAFDVTEDGTSQTLDLVATESLPATLVLLVDNSQSMSRRMEFVRLAAGRLAQALKPRDTLVVAPFTRRIDNITGPTADRTTIVNAIGAMRAGGGTAIYDAMLDAVQLLDGVEGRRAVVLITDGYDENSGADAAAAMEAAGRAHVTIYVVGIGGVAGISLKGETALRDLAERTGGRVFFPPREPDLVAVTDAVAADAHNRYLITYTPSNRKKDGAWRTIEVNVSDGYRVRTRAGYFAPKPPPIRPNIEFTVTDARNAYVSLTADDLEIAEDGAPQEIDTFQEAVDPVSIVMAVDASGSMKKAADAVRQAARSFVRAVRPEDKLAMISFADTTSLAQALSTNRDASLEAIDAYQPLGGTALYDALWDSLIHLRPEMSRRAIVVLTDGRDENNPGNAPGSAHTLNEVLELDRSVGAAVFAIGLGTNVDRPVLERLARESGGSAYFPATVEDLTSEYRRVVDTLRRRYVLSYASTNTRRDGSWRTVRIRPRAPGLHVSSAGGYFAPAQ